MKFERFIGIDVAKNKIDIFDSKTRKTRTISNKAENIQQFFENVDGENVLCIMENTGGFEKVVLERLMELEIAVHKTDNFRVKAYMRSLGLKAKTDAIDAKALAQYGQERWKDLKLLSKTENATDDEIKQLLTYLEELKRMRVAEKNRAKSMGYDMIHDIIRGNLENIEKTIKQIEEKIKELVGKNSAKKEKVDKLTEIKCIGWNSAISLLTFLPELGCASRREIAALAGLAPYAKDSGTIKGYRSTKGNGRPRAKEALFMVALTAIRFNATISEFFNRLVSQGKRKMVALVACMRKILVQANAILKTNESNFITHKKRKEESYVCSKCF